MGMANLQQIVLEMIYLFTVKTSNKKAFAHRRYEGMTYILSV